FDTNLLVSFGENRYPAETARKIDSQSCVDSVIIPNPRVVDTRRRQAKLQNMAHIFVPDQVKIAQMFLCHPQNFFRLIFIIVNGVEIHSLKLYPISWINAILYMPRANPKAGLA